MKKYQYGFGAVEALIILVIVSLLGLGGWYVWIKDSGAPKKPTTSQSQNDTQTEEQGSVSITLINKTSGLPISDTKVSVYSDNGINCVRAPCPTNSKTWEGTTDQYGVITVPKGNIQSSTHVTPEGYQSSSLKYNETTTEYEMVFTSE